MQKVNGLEQSTPAMPGAAGGESTDSAALPQEMMSKLRAPLPKEAISRNPNTGLFAIKAAYVVERLNDVFSLNGWRFVPEVIENGHMVVVKGALTIPAYNIQVEQFGGNDHSDRGDAYKGACTDALSKCASYLGIGIEVYKGLHDDGLKNGSSGFQTRPSNEKTANSTVNGQGASRMAASRKELPMGLTSSNKVERFRSMQMVLKDADYDAALTLHGYRRIEDITELEKAREIYRTLISIFRQRFDAAMKELGFEEYAQILRELRLHPKTRLNPEQAVRVFHHMQKTLAVKE